MDGSKLAGAAWSFVGTDLVESANIWRALEIESMDLLAIPGASVDAQEIDRDPQGQARRFKEPGMNLSNLLYIFGADFADRAINSSDASVRARNTDTLKNVLECCNAADIPSLLILPGVDQPDMSHDDALALSAEVITEMTSVATEASVLLIFEPHVESILESPSETLGFLQQHPDLKIALDYAHFIAQGYGCSDVDPLVPYTGHFHLRQGANKQLQARWEEGEIDFVEVVGNLQEAGYDGYLTLEYEHEPGWMDMDKVDVMTETIKMRNTVKPLLGGK
jgi:sugar phosphate isomerase/epimerase